MRSKIHSGMLCAGFRKTRSEDEKRCQVVGYGDSGGPLTCQDRRSRQWAVVGVASWGERCEDDKMTPGVYTKVQHFNAYVKGVLAEHSVAVK